MFNVLTRLDNTWFKLTIPARNKRIKTFHTLSRRNPITCISLHKLPASSMSPMIFFDIYHEIKLTHTRL